MEYKIVEIEGGRVSEPIPLYGSAAITLDPLKRYTYADYLKWTDNLRRELVDGIAKLMSAPITVHARTSRNIVLKIGSFITRRKGKCEFFYAPIDVRLPQNGETADDKIYTVFLING